MSAPASSLASLRQLLSERFPQAVRSPASALPTGIPGIDEAAGGLPRHALTELVCSAPSCGSQLFLGQLLHTVRAGTGRVALIDGSDSFDPTSWPAEDLSGLIWLRCHGLSDAMSIADLFARDANLELVLLDLRRTALRELRRVPGSTWYRLQRAMEQTNAVFLVLTPAASVPSAQLRLTLDRSLRLSAQSAPRPALTLALAVSVQRQRLSANLAVG
jgi:hypothetical protein